MYQLKIISSSIRPGRKGPIIANWIESKAKSTGNFETQIIDLGKLQLPPMNEPQHPRVQKYEHEYTKKWSATIQEADAFIFVTAEYNFGYPSGLRNALEYLSAEWGYKAAGIVSYGGVSAGTRAANSLKSDLASLRIVPLLEAVNIPFFTQFISATNEFIANEITEKSADTMLRELVRWTKGLKIIKENAS